jgi:CheY-like chemotaxis protein
MRVLVVEDEAEFANLIAEGLRDQGMAVDVAYDGLAGASSLNLNPYDVIVLDRDLPGLHGDTLCRMITQSQDPAMILMLTAAGSPVERVAGLALGADDYLPKPFHFPELVLRIRALARRNPPLKTEPSRPQASNSTHSLAAPPATAYSSTSRPKSSPCSKPSSGSALARSARNDCSSRPGMRTWTRSPTRFASRSADCAASSGNRRSSRTHPASDAA